MSENKNKKNNIGKILLAVCIILLVVLLFSTFLNKKNDDTVDNNANNPSTRDIFSSYYNNLSSGYSGNWKLGSNVGQLNDNVASGVKAKRTQILGSNKDKMTIMVYMCGSDLESKNSMGVYDLQEMTAASISDNINLIVYTGGTTKWHTNVISSQYNQIYKVHSGGIELLVQNAGTGSMVDPNTLSDFIEWATSNYEANRYQLIFWDHGSGSVGGYGYDEKYPNNGSMSLAQIDEALTEADVSFDFIGFDACLMANTETALMLAEHADYLVASEESEPGIGWYYTDWLNAVSKNSSMPTIEIGKTIADSFVSECYRSTPGQSATLSVVDLAELSAIIPSKLSAYSLATTNLINNNNYKTVASARSGSREFAASTYSDLVDLIDMASSVGTTEADDLVNSLLSCIKYNNTSRDMYNSYGLSIYFPYRSTKYVSTMLKEYDKIDMNKEYSDCVRNFATYVSSGQLSSGGSHNAYQSFNSYGQGYGNNSNSYDYYYSQQSSGDLIYDLLGMLMSSGSSYTNNSSYQTYYAGDLLSLLFGSGIDRNMTNYIADNHFDADLTWKDGKITLSEKQLSLIDSIEYNVFIDDGTGYIDLGKDNVFDWDDDGNLIPTSNTWLVASNDNKNWQVIPYYFSYAVLENDSLISYGSVPVRINGQQAELNLVLDDNGIEMVGIRYVYDDVDVVAKNLYEFNEGDEIEFICSFFDYDGNYSDFYVLGDKLVIKDKLYLGDASIADYKTLAFYEIKDIYQQSYWTTPIQ